MLDRPDLLVDDHMATIGSSDAGRAWFLGELITAFKQKTTQAWCDVFEGSEIRYAPVRDYAGVAADVNVWENGYLASTTAPDGSPKSVVGTPIRLSGTPLTPGAHAPTLGEHTDDVLAEYGFDAEEIATLRDSGVI